MIYSDFRNHIVILHFAYQYMLLKIILLAIVALLFVMPIIFNKKLFIDRSTNHYAELLELQEKNRNSKLRWNGPETDERINQMSAECIRLMRELGVPISDSICPEVKLNGSHRNYGLCCTKGSKKKYSRYEYYIEISGYTLRNSEKSLRNTLIHELIHTVPGGLCHTGEWKKWAKFVSERTEYDIKRLDGDKTSRDVERLGNYGRTNWLRP